MEACHLVLVQFQLEDVVEVRRAARRRQANRDAYASYRC
jgi:hypothetical protein